jgi:hypothetical protein
MRRLHPLHRVHVHVVLAVRPAEKRTQNYEGMLVNCGRAFEFVEALSQIVRLYV